MRKNRNGVVSDLKKPYRTRRPSRAFAERFFFLLLCLCISAAHAQRPTLLFYMPRDSSSEWNTVIVAMKFRTTQLSAFVLKIDTFTLYRLGDTNYLNMPYANGTWMDRDMTAPTDFNLVSIVDDMHFPVGWHTLTTTISDSNGFTFSAKTNVIVKQESLFVQDTHVDTMQVKLGWNMVGTSYPVSVATISTIPPGIIVSSFYGYNVGYFSAAILIPNTGYWLKAQDVGKVVLPRIALVKTSALPRIPRTR